MTTPFTRAMARATELTKAGRLDDATRLIRSLLQAAPAGAATDAASDRAPADTGERAPVARRAGDVIDGTFTRLEDAAPDAAPDPAPTPDPAPRDKTRSRAARAVRRTIGTTLRDTLRDLAGRGKGRSGAAAALKIDVPTGAQFLARTHAGPHGTRDYRLYLPATRTAGPLPLVVMLHGCTQSAEDFATGTGMNALAEEFGCIIAYPTQPTSANAQACWNWFRPQDQARDAGEPALIAGIVADVLCEHPADPARVYVAGLSAGGAAAAIMGAAYPDLVAAVGVHSGLPVGSARDLPSALAAMRGGAQGTVPSAAVPTIVFHGLADRTVNPANGTAVEGQILGARQGLRAVRVAGRSGAGHAYRQTRHDGPDGRSVAEHWQIEGMGHAWSGGRADGSHTDPRGPDASREMLRFFLQHRRDG